MIGNMAKHCLQLAASSLCVLEQSFETASLACSELPTTTQNESASGPSLIRDHGNVSLNCPKCVGQTSSTPEQSRSRHGELTVHQLEITVDYKAYSYLDCDSCVTTNGSP
jgi:hypothetical protein